MKAAWWDEFVYFQFYITTLVFHRVASIFIKGTYVVKADETTLIGYFMFGERYCELFRGQIGGSCFMPGSQRRQGNPAAHREGGFVDTP